MDNNSLAAEMASNLSKFSAEVFSFKPSGYILALDFIEILFLVKALMLSILVIALTLKFKVFHLNLRILFCNQFVANIFFILIRLAIIINILNPESMYSLTTINWLENIHHGLVEFFSINLLSIFIERLQSTVKAASYENYFTFYKLILLMGFPWLVSSGITLVSQYNLIDMSPMLGITLSMNALFLLCFIALHFFNKKQGHKFDIHTTLSYRFQIQENIATMKFLSYLSFIYSIYLIATMALIYLIFNVFHKAQQLIPVIVGSCVFNILAAFYCFIVPLIFILNNKKLCKFFCFCYSARIAPHFIEELKDAELQRNLYFIGLQKQWS